MPLAASPVPTALVAPALVAPATIAPATIAPAAIALPRAGLGPRGGEASGALRIAVAALVAATALLPYPSGTLAVLAIVVVLGVPHGALDGEVARGLLRMRVGRAWFPVFAAPYLALAAGVLVAWRLAPSATLAGFLALSVVHFGEEDSGGDGGVLAVLARGGLAIAVPVLAHPFGVSRVFATVMATPLDAPPSWLLAAAWAWLAAAAAWLAWALAARRDRDVAEFAALAVVFAVLPPLPAFALYFVCVHAPRHVAALAADPRRAPRVVDARSALMRSLPITALTFAIGAALWPLYAGRPPERLLALTLQGLAALTLPHMVLDVLSARLAARAPAPGGA